MKKIIICIVIQCILLILFSSNLIENINTQNNCVKIQTKIDRIGEQKRGFSKTRYIYVNFYDRSGKIHKAEIIRNCNNKSMKENDIIDIWYEKKDPESIYYIDSKKTITYLILNIIWFVLWFGTYKFFKWRKAKKQKQISLDGFQFFR